jgi:hypothetical protein
MKWTKIDDPMEERFDCYYIETADLRYVAEITGVRRYGSYLLRLYDNDTLVAKPREFMSFARAKRSGQAWMAKTVKKSIKALEKTLKDLQKVE